MQTNDYKQIKKFMSHYGYRHWANELFSEIIWTLPVQS